MFKRFKKEVRELRGAMADGLNHLSSGSENNCQDLNSTSINYKEVKEFIKEETLKRKISKSVKATDKNRKYTEGLKAVLNEFDSGFFQTMGVENQLFKLCKKSICISTIY
jgi:hypothetical protein